MGRALIETLRGGQAGHFGCIGIEERCEKLGAAVRWHSAPGQGAALEIRLALEIHAMAGKRHVLDHLLSNS